MEIDIRTNQWADSPNSHCHENTRILKNNIGAWNGWIQEYPTLIGNISSSMEWQTFEYSKRLNKLPWTRNIGEETLF